jgi:hypothetical protein
MSSFSRQKQKKIVFRVYRASTNDCQIQLAMKTCQILNVPLNVVRSLKIYPQVGVRESIENALLV